jgi:hypothetical protein
MSAAAPPKKDEKKENGAVGKKKVKQRRHHFLVSGTKFVCDTFYQPIKQVGTGAYGVVWYVDNLSQCSAFSRSLGNLHLCFFFY